jgi:hypothetical protein
VGYSVPQQNQLSGCSKGLFLDCNKERRKEILKVKRLKVKKLMFSLFHAFLLAKAYDKPSLYIFTETGRLASLPLARVAPLLAERSVSSQTMRRSINRFRQPPTNQTLE